MFGIDRRGHRRRSGLFLLHVANRRSRASRNYNFNVNLSDSNSNSNSNDNSNDDSNSNSNSSAATSMSDDDKHKLFHAASLTGDAELIQRVNVKIGILNDDFTPGDAYQQFAIDHAYVGLPQHRFHRGDKHSGKSACLRQRKF